MPDLPDWWQGFFLVGSDITINVTIEASDVTLPISIDAATVTLDVNLAGQDVTIDFNFADKSVAVFDAAKWFAHNAAQVFLYGTSEISAGSYTDIATRTVPDGKTFYVAGMSFGVTGGSQPTHVCVVLLLGGANIVPYGGEQGGGLIFDVPIRATTGQAVALRAFNDDAAATAFIKGGLWGWDEEV